jgi:CspA family cold shock protein
MTGTIKWFHPHKGFGFITPDQGGSDVFVHRRELRDASVGAFAEGQKVVFRVVERGGRREATDLAPLP